MRHYMHATPRYLLGVLTADPRRVDLFKTEDGSTPTPEEATAWLRSLRPDALLPCGHDDCAQRAEHAEVER